MDLNRYTRLGVVSPAEGFSQPEILQEAKQGYIDDDLQRTVDRAAVFALLNGQRPSSDPQSEAYRLLLVGTCNAYNAVMPFLFEKIADYTELLMPLDLLSEHSVLHALREALTAENCQDVEVIGWLYQYYISERKDEVFEALKNNQKIEAKDIPAATQLFTPHWIVRYLVENSLGRLWLLNRPASKLAEKMDYYIKPVQEESDFLRISSPEEIKLNDPACGSGHMLTYSFDLLYAIYEEEGYPAVEIPRLILEKNLYGIEIDPRAGALAAFALFMKARAKDRRFFSRPVQPNICVLENVSFTDQELDDYMKAVGRDLFTEPLRQTLKQFGQADNFGSLIRPALTDTTYVRQEMQAKNLDGNIFLYSVHERVLRVLKQAEYLAPRYHVVVANPPYMGASNMGEELKSYISDVYSDVKSDLFSAFIARNFELAVKNGQLGFMTPFVWMFIASYEKLREIIIKNKTITSLIQLEYSGFEGATVPICTFTLENAYNPRYFGGYIRLSDFRGSENQAPKTLEAVRNPSCGWFYRAKASEFEKIPGSPIAYWTSEKIRALYQKSKSLFDVASIVCGMTTGDNNQFLRLWHEVSNSKCGWHVLSAEQGVQSQKKWFPYNKGGNFRKWYGNNSHLINWEADGRDVISNGRAFPRAKHLYFRDSITWSFISSSYFGVRASDSGFIFDMSGCSAFPYSQSDKSLITAFLCSKLAFEQLQIMNPTLNFQVGNVGALPWLEQEIKQHDSNIRKIYHRVIELAKWDWDSSESSWGFLYHPLLKEGDVQKENILQAYNILSEYWKRITEETHNLEEKNNRIFIEAYGLQDELAPDVPLEEITLTCNPYYRYGGKKSEEELERLLRADTMREFISYAVGCMFGRYSLDKPGLILANQGETVEDYRRQMAQSGVQWDEVQFTPDEDNAIPILDGEWFSDDISERFKKFLRVTFGNEHYTENLAFIEEAIGRDIRSYFVKEFYDQHLKMYKKRPIYWLFSSPQGSFNVLIYMHRYTPDTVSVILNRYLREFKGKLEARRSFLEHISISASAAPREKTAALKEIEKLNKTLDELRAYEREILFPLAAQRLAIDLDDGVKVNYAKFGKALAKIPGM